MEPLELVPLATAKVGVKPIIWLPDTPLGTRGIGELSSFEMTGERITARLHGTAAADWATVSPDGTVATIDVRFMLETDDGALLYASYKGRSHMSATPPYLYTAPQFDTGDERYQWLTRIQVVGKGLFSPDLTTMDIDYYELR